MFPSAVGVDEKVEDFKEGLVFLFRCNLWMVKIEYNSIQPFFVNILNRYFSTFFFNYLTKVV